MHLYAASGQRSEDLGSLRASKRSRLITAAAIHHDNFLLAFEMLKTPEGFGYALLLIQGGNDNTDSHR